MTLKVHENNKKKMISVSCTVLIVEKTSVVSTRKNLVERDSSPHVLEVIQRQYPIVNGITERAFRIPQARIFGIPESGLPYMGRNRTESVENIGFIVELRTLRPHSKDFFHKLGAIRAMQCCSRIGFLDFMK